MGASTWRTRAGVALALLGAIMLFIQLRTPPAEPPVSEEPYYFELSLMGKKLLRVPARAEDLAAALRAKWLILSLIPLAGGAFLLFLDTEAGGRFEKLFRKITDDRDKKGGG
ncbi:hypothetical protein ACFLQ0_02125 [Nitrospinota bacterium]